MNILTIYLSYSILMFIFVLLFWTTVAYIDSEIKKAFKKKSIQRGAILQALIFGFLWPLGIIIFLYHFIKPLERP